MKTILITGASRGIGRAIALELACSGTNIILNYKENHEAAQDVERRILEKGAACLRCACDVRSIDAVRKMHADVKKTFGYTNIIINNAGVARGGLIQDVTDEDYDYIMDTNLRGIFNVSRAFVPDLIANKSGRIVNMSSMWGEVGAAFETIYSTSKAGIIGFTKSLAKELAPSNITVNAIAPGAILTDMLTQLGEDTIDALKDEIPLGRIGKPSDIAAVVANLVSDSLGYVTGQIINVSGGLSIS